MVPDLHLYELCVVVHVFGEEEEESRFSLFVAAVVFPTGGRV